MRILSPYFVNFLATLLLLSCSLPALQAQERVRETIEFDGSNRSYRLYIPSSYDADSPMPLVFNLHGITSDAFQQELYSGMNAVAEKNGFIVCYPNGKGRSWAVEFPILSSTVNEVQFISELIDALAEDYTIDLNRVYSCGISNGGYMSHKLACNLSDKIVAIASVAGSFVPGQEALCNPTRPVPTLQIHGTSDLIVLYNGNFVAVPAEDAVEFWRAKNGCSSDAIVTAVPNKSWFDFSRAERRDYTDCTGESAVAFYKVRNGGHTWPGANLPIPLGQTNQDFDASEEIWNFFKQFSFEEKETVGRFKRNISETIRFFPNPTYNQITIETNLPAAATLSRSLYNMQGQQLLGTEVQSFPKGMVSWNYELGNLPLGTYLLKVQDGSAITTQKVMILK